MCATTADSTATILLFDVPWTAYTGLIDALPDHRIPHTYQEGTLELFNNVLLAVPWGAYEKILDAFGDRRFPHTYQEGALEIMMSPSEEHEQIKSFLGRLIETAALKLGIHFKAVGSATQRDKTLLQGLEPDESYYIPYAAPVAWQGRRPQSKRNRLLIWQSKWTFVSWTSNGCSLTRNWASVSCGAIATGNGRILLLSRETVVRPRGPKPHISYDRLERRNAVRQENASHGRLFSHSIVRRLARQKAPRQLIAVEN